MDRRTMLTTTLGTALAMTLAGCAGPDTEKGKTMDDVTKASYDAVMAFMGAMGSGDFETMTSLMADDMVWHNEGDKSLPWIGPWEGKDAILQFLPLFGENMETTKWDNQDAFASGDTVAVFGRMNGKMKKSGKDIGEFTFALRAKVRDGKLVLWNWFEDSYAISKAFHGE